MRTFGADLLLLSSLFLCVACTRLSHCPNGIIIFGDSLSDTGAAANVFPNVPGNRPPYGVTNPGYPTGRFSDGHLMVDFISDAWNLKAEPYFQTVNPDYKRGINFAQAGATALDTVFLNPIYFSYQLQEFLQFKQRLLTSHRDSCDRSLPPSDFYKTFFCTVEIGGNDIIGSIVSENNSLPFVANVTIPEVVAAVKSGLQLLHDQGGRNFMVFTITPLGCIPFFKTIFATSDPAAYDSYHCLKAFNNISSYYNLKLSEAVVSLRAQYNDSKFYIADLYNSYYYILSKNTTYGFTNTEAACCGVGGPPYNYSPVQECGAPGTTVCSNPNSYISWDGIHYTQHYYRTVVNLLLNGSFLDPPVKIC